MKKLLPPFQVLAIMAMPPLLMLTNLLWAAGEVNLYRYGFAKYHVDGATGISLSELSKAASGLVRYFGSSEEPVSVTVLKDGRTFELFNDKEKAHLRDVKGLIRLGDRIRAGILVFVFHFVMAVSWRHRHGGYRRALARAGLWASGLTLALMAAFGLAAVADFNWLFLQFHLLSFANDLWMLDPATDYLIRLVPQGFFYDATLMVAGATVAEALLLGGVCWAYLGRRRA